MQVIFIVALYGGISMSETSNEKQETMCIVPDITSLLHLSTLVSKLERTIYDQWPVDCDLNVVIIAQINSARSMITSMMNYLKDVPNTNGKLLRTTELESQLARARRRIRAYELQAQLIRQMLSNENIFDVEEEIKHYDTKPEELTRET